MAAAIILTTTVTTLEKAMAPHSSTLAWKIPGTGEPGGLPSMGSHRVGHDWVLSLHFTFTVTTTFLLLLLWLLLLLIYDCCYCYCCKRRAERGITSFGSKQMNHYLFLACFSFFFLKYEFIYFTWRLVTLQYCIGFAIHQHESATGYKNDQVLWNKNSRVTSAQW